MPDTSPPKTARAADLFETLGELSGAHFAELDVLGRFRFASTPFQQLLGRDTRHLTGLPFTDMVHLDDAQAVHALVFDAAERPSQAQVRLSVQGRGFVVFDVRVALAGERILLVARDPGRRESADVSRHDRDELFRHLFEDAPTGMALVDLDDLAVVRSNGAFARSLGYAASDLEGWPFSAFSHPDDVGKHVALDERLLAGELPSLQGERRFRRKDGSTMHALVQVGLLRDQSGRATHIVAQVVDISERKAAEAALEHSATHDALTGLPNGRLFREFLSKAVAHGARTKESYAVMYLDLDRFKVVNDSLGHGVGDQLLVAVAGRLKAAIRASDVVARQGGDEFTILLQPPADLDDCLRAAERLLSSLADPVLVGGREVVPGGSLGIALSRAQYQEPEEPLRDADTAMYRAKAMGGGRVVVFDSAMHKRMLSVFSLENELRLGLAREEFEPYFQPIVDLADGHLAGFESLVRWNHPGRGVLGPGAFLQVAEDTGLVVPMGIQALEKTLAVMAEWKQELGVEALPWVSVNLSNRQFQQPDVVTSLVSAVESHGIPPARLHVEITESVVMTDTEVAGRVLAELRRVGFGLDVDDFGTGYSSLAALDRFPIDALKIDASFVRRDHGRHPLVAAIVGLGRLLELKTVAEGIETREQLEALRSRGCDFGQGYYFSRPVPASAALALIRSQKTW